MALIIIQKIVWASILILLSGVLVWLHAVHVTQPLQELFESELTADPHDMLANLLIGLIPSLSLQAELLIAAGAAVYAVLEAVEVWGLWNDIVWAEVLIVIEMGALLPYDVWEFVQHPSPFKIVTIGLNALIVWYLAGRYQRRRIAFQNRRLIEERELLMEAEADADIVR